MSVTYFDENFCLEKISVAVGLPGWVTDYLAEFGIEFFAFFAGESEVVGGGFDVEALVIGQGVHFVNGVEWKDKAFRGDVEGRVSEDLAERLLIDFVGNFLVTFGRCEEIF